MEHQTITIRLQVNGFLVYTPEYDQLTVETVKLLPTSDVILAMANRLEPVND